MSEDNRDIPKANILIVDDKRENILALREILSNPGYNLIEARSGTEALRQLLKEEFALVLLDVLMPEMDGFEVARIIKSRERTRDLPIIFLTAMVSDVDSIYKAYDVGAVDYIQKPLEPHVVKGKVAVFIDLFRKSQQIKRQTELLKEKELKEKERELQEVRETSERKYQDLVEGINSGIVWSSDPITLRFSYVSPRAEPILGYPLRQWFEEPAFWAHHLYPADREMVLDGFKKAQTGKEVSFEHRFISARGEIAWFHTGVRLAKRGPGAGNEIRGISVDITHMKNIEDALRDALRTRDEFLSIASHELNTPLTSLKLQIEMAKRTLEANRKNIPTAEKYLTSFEKANKSADRLSDLITDLLDVSRIRAGRLSFTFKQEDLTNLVSDVIDRFQGQAARAGCIIDFSGKEQVSIWCDRFRMEQVMTNLLSNAIKYGAGKPIMVRVTRRDSNALIAVRDYGMGIEKGMHERIFERFERAVSSQHVGGLGLGLYITREIVTGHHGRVLVKSKPGHGSKFEVIIPMELKSSLEKIASTRSPHEEVTI